MKKKIRILQRNIRYLLPKEYIHKRLYYKALGKKLNLKQPKNFNEKIQYMNIYEYGNIQTKLTDKYLVRNYIKEKGYENLLPKLYKVYKNVNEINIEELPDKFVLKANNGCGNVCICTNKKEFDVKKAKEHLNYAIKNNFAKENLEYHYKNIKPCIICEEYIEDKNRINPIDYKIYCFYGKPECILVCSNREIKLNLDYYDINWNYLEYAKKQYRSKETLEKPKKLSEMLKIARKLSEDFKFVRVDLYNIDEKIYFGELTFTPAAGTIYYNTEESLTYLGSLLEIDKGKK